MQTLQDIEQVVNRAAAQRDNLVSQIAKRDQEIQLTVTSVQAHEQVQALIQDTAKTVQEELRFHIQDLVQHALDTLLPGTYVFRVEFEVSRGKTSANLVLEKDGYPLEDILNECGGTVADIVGLALRVAVWTLARTDNCILLDEPGRHISAEFKPLFGELLKGLSEKLGIQFLVVSHDQAIIDYADRVFEVSQVDGVSRVRVKGGNQT